MSVVFIAGIDTAIGKTVVTGLMARYLIARGFSVITQKVVQTGSRGLAVDILAHRRLMGVDPDDHDLEGITCPYVFAFPASPHLAAAREGREVDVSVLTRSTASLADVYDYVLIEGAGGLCVPLNTEVTVLDYLEETGYPVIVVSSPKLGSINHTFLTLEALRRRRLYVPGIAYNCFSREDPEIEGDSRRLFGHYLDRHGMGGAVVDVPEVSDATDPPLLDFSPFFPEE